METIFRALKTTPTPFPSGAHENHARPLGGEKVHRTFSCFRLAPRKGGGSKGFTLIEVAVVMLVIVIVLGLVTVNLEPDRETPVRDEARRLAVLLQTAQQEAILQGKVLALAFGREGYQFLILTNANEFKPVSGDDVLRARPLPPGVVISAIDIEGAAEDEQPRLMLLPTGELQAFTVVFSRGDIRWRVKGTLTGEVTAESVAAADNA